MLIGIFALAGVAACSGGDASTDSSVNSDPGTFCDAVGRADAVADEVTDTLASLGSVDPVELARVLGLTVSAAADIAATAPSQIRSDAARSLELARLNRDVFAAADYVAADADLAPLREVGIEAVQISERLDAFGVAECGAERSAESARLGNADVVVRLPR